MPQNVMTNKESATWHASEPPVLVENRRENSRGSRLPSAPGSHRKRAAPLMKRSEVTVPASRYRSTSNTCLRRQCRSLPASHEITPLLVPSRCLPKISNVEPRQIGEPTHSPDKPCVTRSRLCSFSTPPLPKALRRFLQQSRKQQPECRRSLLSDFAPRPGSDTSRHTI